MVSLSDDPICEPVSTNGSTSCSAGGLADEESMEDGISCDNNSVLNSPFECDVNSKLTNVNSVCIDKNSISMQNTLTSSLDNNVDCDNVDVGIVHDNLDEILMLFLMLIVPIWLTILVFKIV